jgi:hypothetical protein
MADIQLERYDGPQPDPLVAGCVNPQQIRSWLVDCEENHGARCIVTEHQSATLTAELKFVDVIDHCIVSAPTNARYFALSYMWGGVQQLLLTTENRAELSAPRSIQQYQRNIPAVIQDAIHFVATLDERYLWLDSLCIVQNDASIKHTQILQMGSIYNGAVACLVGAVGSDATSGLAGVRSHTRTPEPKRPQYRAVYLVNPGPEEYTSFRKPQDNSPFIKLGKRLKARQLDLNNRLLRSEYSSRGWTYQERILSRRCIYFMENMVYYHCRKAIRAENKATPYSQKDEDIQQLSLFMADPIFSGDHVQYFRISAHYMLESSQSSHARSCPSHLTFWMHSLGFHLLWRSCVLGEWLPGYLSTFSNMPYSGPPASQCSADLRMRESRSQVGPGLVGMQKLITRASSGPSTILSLTL